MAKLSEEELRRITEDAKKKVKVHCDEYHLHTAIGGCLTGDKDAIDKLKLIEHIHFLECLIEDMYKRYQKGY